jgi:hypothetical protein
MSATADGVTDHSEDRQNQADEEDDNSDRPDNGDFYDEPDYEENYAEKDHGGAPVLLLAAPEAGRSGVSQLPRQNHLKLFLVTSRPVSPPLWPPYE